MLEPLFVYVLHATGTEFVKIGSTTDLPSRIKTIQTGCPHLVHFLCCMTCPPGLHNLEHRIHHALSTFRMQGEWFHLPVKGEQEVIAYITGVVHDILAQAIPVETTMPEQFHRSRTTRRRTPISDDASEGAPLSMFDVLWEQLQA